MDTDDDEIVQICPLRWKGNPLEEDGLFLKISLTYLLFGVEEGISEFLPQFGRGYHNFPVPGTLSCSFCLFSTFHLVCCLDSLYWRSVSSLICMRTNIAQWKVFQPGQTEFQAINVRCYSSIMALPFQLILLSAYDLHKFLFLLEVNFHFRRLSLFLVTLHFLFRTLRQWSCIKCGHNI